MYDVLAHDGVLSERRPAPKITRDETRGLSSHQLTFLTFEAPFRERVFECSVSSGPAFFFKGELNDDALGGLFNHVKSDSIGAGILREAFATASRVTGVACILNAGWFRNKRSHCGAALALVGIAERKARRDRPGALIGSYRGIEKGTRHSTVS